MADLLNELPPQEEEQEQEQKKPSQAHNPVSSALHRDISEDLDFDENALDENHGIIWNQNVRLVLAICVVILSAVFVWWFVS
ncbi:MAG: hypothetical protein J5803_05690 [Desulfovibrio sp.]|nr:hypothetical protein [Desulfovibrio sp.]